MLPIILLCMLLQAFSTCSLINVDEQSQVILSEEGILENLETAFREAFNDVEGPTVFLSRLMQLRQAAEGCWKMCLDKMSAYSQNQHFFQHTLPDFIEDLYKYLKRGSSSDYAADAPALKMKIFCELQACRTYMEVLKQLARLFKNGSSPFEGLSDEFLTLAADYVRNTIKLHELYSMVENPDFFNDPQLQSVRDPICQNDILQFLVSLRSLVKNIQKVDFMDNHHRFSSALKAIKRTIVPANRALVDFLTDFTIWGVPSLAEKVSDSISESCDRFGFATSAHNILIDIEAITVPLCRANFDLNRGVAEQRERGEIFWESFIESLFAFESVLAKPRISAVKPVSEAFSQLVNHLFDIFLRGEDEVWTLELLRKLNLTKTLWRRVLETLNVVSDINELVCWLRYNSCLLADLFVVLHIIKVVEKLEDSLALDRPTRKKFFEFWEEARTLLRITRSLSLLKRMARHLGTLAKFLDATVIKESLSCVFDEEINAVKRYGVNFRLGKYHQFINDLPEHREAITHLLKTFSDDLSHSVLERDILSMIDAIFSPLKSPIYTPLKQSLKELFKSPPQLPQPRSLPSRTTRPKNKKSKKRGNNSRGSPKSHTAAVSKAPAPPNMRASVRNGPQHVSANSAIGSAGDDLRFEGNFEDPWTLVEAPRNRQTFGSLASQSAREVLKRFVRKPLGWDGVPPTNHRDMRSDKTKLKIATFNAEWLFLFNLSTDKLYGKIKWRSLKEAWDHIKDVANAIQKIDADIICLCEVQDMRILSILVELLPELNYRAYLIPNHDSLGQNVAILARVDTFVSAYRIDEWFFPKNIVFHLKLDNGRGGLVDVVLTGVHLISSTAEADHAERARHREDQARALKQHLHSHYDTSGDVIHLVLGDFNMVDLELLSTEAAHLSEKALKVLKTEPFRLFNIMDSKTVPGNRVPLSNSVCHIFTTHPLLASNPQLFSFNDADAPFRLERVSDHLPIVTTIDLLKHCQ